MKLHTNEAPGLNQITSYGPDWIEVNRERHASALLLLPSGPPMPWNAADVASLDAASFEALLAHEPELVLLGTGQRQQFVHPRTVEALTRRLIAVDAMTTPAACRTFNILVAEGRRPLAALLIGSD